MEARKRHEIGRDRFSNLPEPIIHHILSFMDMRYVIETSILARRWRNLWYSLPFLSFDEYEFRDDSGNSFDEEFSDFVNMVMLRRDSSPIQSFNLDWNASGVSARELNHIHQWIRTAVLRNVKEIKVDLNPDLEKKIQFHDCFFTSKSLTSLKLVSLNIVPDRISLPSLKTLHLESLELFKYDNFIDILLLGCPALETLILIQCEFTESKVVTISSQHLKHLRIDMSYSYNELLEGFVIHASNLLDYTWRSHSWIAFSLEGLSSLETANIDPRHCYSPLNCKDSKDLELDEYGADEGMMIILKELYNVKHLTLSSVCLQLVSKFRLELEKWPTSFSNLRYLNLQTWLTRGCFEVTMFLLKNSPNIETLVLHMDPIDSEKTVEHGVESSWNLKLHHLKVVELQKVIGCKNELQHLKILLGNAETLEKITIVESKLNNAKKWNVFIAKVLTLPRASSDVTINFKTTKKMDRYHCTSMDI